ncbi:thioredoxin [Spirosoma aureum]|uniref:Thioredoxin n=1 Tax=Spirosoma aureum TaxID=2692134 RepID=A0A6G9AS16_9BACT|nr:thioredoxin domain-containing protein [Spirosoma aureum]QIP15126.1 thioredoxin [Spirosoma aureum]
METNHPKQLKYNKRLPVLLVFMPKDAHRHLLINDVVEQLLEKLTGKVQLLKIEEVVHPGVVLSFNVTQLPTFVLVNKGKELWRYEGLPTESLLSLVELHIS